MPKSRKRAAAARKIMEERERNRWTGLIPVPEDELAELELEARLLHSLGLCDCRDDETV